MPVPWPLLHSLATDLLVRSSLRDAAALSWNGGKVMEILMTDIQVKQAVRQQKAVAKAKKQKLTYRGVKYLLIK